MPQRLLPFGRCSPHLAEVAVLDLGDPEAAGVIGEVGQIVALLAHRDLVDREVTDALRISLIVGFRIA